MSDEPSFFEDILDPGEEWPMTVTNEAPTVSNALTVPPPVFRLPPELEGWVVNKAQPDARGNGWVVWLERTMPDGTTLRLEALIHDYERELPMLVPVIQAVTALSMPDMRLSVTRTKSDRFQIERGKHRPRLVGPVRSEQGIW